LCGFCGQKLDTKDIHKEMFSLYGRKSLSRKEVHNWVEKFSQGRSKVAGDTRPSRPVETATEATVQRVEELIRADSRITIDSVAISLACTASSRQWQTPYSLSNPRENQELEQSGLGP
jgi:hypothetical protein